MENTLIVRPSSALVSRKTAIEERNRVITALETNKAVTLDLSDIVSISDSYADEFFGVLSVILSLDQMFERIKVAGATDYHLQVIATAVHRRQAASANAA